ncbi:MAG: hypothetical protein ACXAC2_20920, partial [Candidatus Kariarchaeaceae archaeon]
AFILPIFGYLLIQTFIHFKFKTWWFSSCTRGLTMRSFLGRDILTLEDDGTATILLIFREQ